MNHTSNPQDARAELSAKLWQIAEQHIVAEWICCEPCEPKHELCAKGYAALAMARTLLVDDPGAARSAPLLDAVLGLLPAVLPSVVVSADRATLTDSDRQFLTFALDLAFDRMVSDDGFTAEDEAALEKLRRLSDGPSRVAAEEQPAETQAHPPSHTWTVESPRRDNWASWGATYDDRDWARERYESATSTAPARPFRLVRATTTYIVETEHTPPAVAEQPDTQTREARAGRCSAVMLRVHHAPHGWEPQPGMDPVHCPGYPQPGKES